MPEPSPGDKKTPGPLRFAGLGIQLAASILLFVFIGQWLDRRFGGGGLFTIVGAFVGFGGTMWSLVRALRQEDRQDK